jgi:hypothetical protein
MPNSNHKEIAMIKATHRYQADRKACTHIKITFTVDIHTFRTVAAYLLNEGSEVTRATVEAELRKQLANRPDQVLGGYIRDGINSKTVEQGEALADKLFPEFL